MAGHFAPGTEGMLHMKSYQLRSIIILASLCCFYVFVSILGDQDSPFKHVLGRDVPCFVDMTAAQRDAAALEGQYLIVALANPGYLHLLNTQDERYISIPRIPETLWIHRAAIDPERCLIAISYKDADGDTSTKYYDYRHKRFLAETPAVDVPEPPGIVTGWTNKGRRFHIIEPQTDLLAAINDYKPKYNGQYIQDIASGLNMRISKREPGFHEPFCEPIWLENGTKLIYGGVLYDATGLRREVGLFGGCALGAVQVTPEDLEALPWDGEGYTPLF